MRTTAEDIACAVLGCGTYDLAMLDDVQYDVTEIILGLMTDNYGEFNINDVMREVFHMGVVDIENAIDQRLDEIGRLGGDDEPDEIKEERAALLALCPVDDIESFHNFIDTHVWITPEHHAQDYRRYLGDALDEFAENTGFEISLD